MTVAPLAPCRVVTRPSSRRTAFALLNLIPAITLRVYAHVVNEQLAEPC